ncbi:MAG: prepilin-type N-terminal cleavage/methylation domain-containing protein [Pseudomonadota bacterium]
MSTRDPGRVTFSHASRPDRSRVTRRAGGFTLVELVVFIAIVAVAVAGVLGVLQFTTQRSSDPLPQKQALAIAESLLEEVALMPFTWCDPDDPAAATATGPGDCATPEAIGPEAGETRYSATAPFDNVNDYHGFDTALAAPPGIRDITAGAIPGLDAYRATISVVQESVGGIPASELLRITVTVTGPGDARVVLDGYRAQFAPAEVP